MRTFDLLLAGAIVKACLKELMKKRLAVAFLQMTFGAWAMQPLEHMVSLGSHEPVTSSNLEGLNLLALQMVTPISTVVLGSEFFSSKQSLPSLESEKLLDIINLSVEAQDKRKWRLPQGLLVRKSRRGRKKSREFSHPPVRYIVDSDSD